MSHRADGTVSVRARDGVAGFAGLVTCGSVWICPVCSAKVNARRALEIGTVVASAAAEGLQVAFCTMTLRHHRNQSLKALVKGQRQAWGRATSGVKWKKDRERIGLVGYVRVIEITHGKNGWHPHTHLLLIAENLDTPTALDNLMNPTWQRWSAGAQQAGLSAPLPHASEWHLVQDANIAGTNLGEYLSKGFDRAGAIGQEMTNTQSKTARAVHSTRPHWQILGDAINGEVAGLDLWWEYERATKGMRQIAWSRGLRERFNIGVEATDEEIAAEEMGDDDDDLVEISPKGWRRLVDVYPLELSTALEIATIGGQSALSIWLQNRDIEHRLV